MGFGPVASVPGSISAGVGPLRRGGGIHHPAAAPPALALGGHGGRAPPTYSVKTNASSASAATGAGKTGGMGGGVGGGKDKTSDAGMGMASWNWTRVKTYMEAATKYPRPMIQLCRKSDGRRWPSDEFPAHMQMGQAGPILVHFPLQPCLSTFCGMSWVISVTTLLTRAQVEMNNGPELV